MINENYAKAYEEVFGASLDSAKKYGKKIKHPVTGEMVYEKQIRYGKTKKDRNNI